MKDKDKRIIKGKETKKNIINEAIRLFSKDGYDGTSIKDITHAAKIPKSLFYHYFRSKDEILQYIIQLYDLRVTGREKESIKQNSIDKLAGRILQKIQKNADILKIVLIEALKNESILEILLKKTDLLDENISSNTAGAVRDKNQLEKMKVLWFYFKIIPGIMYAFTKDEVARFYDIQEEDLFSMFLDLISQDTYTGVSAE